MDDITLKQYFEIFTAAWKLFKKFRDLKTDKDRKELGCVAEKIYNKYPCDLIMDLNWAVFNELDRRAGVSADYLVNRKDTIDFRGVRNGKSGAPQAAAGKGENIHKGNNQTGH